MQLFYEQAAKLVLSVVFIDCQPTQRIKSGGAEDEDNQLPAQFIFINGGVDVWCRPTDRAYRFRGRFAG